jgi:uncharacterized protein
MLQISEDAILARLHQDNPWWTEMADLATPPYTWKKRAAYPALVELLKSSVRRAIIFLGARRVGKTTMLQQLLGELSVSKSMGPLFYASIDAPTLAGRSLENLIALFERAHPHDTQAQRLIIFDEIQYHPDWERHLKDLIDRFPHTRFVASGSAGAALKRKSQESGAGRFTDFELPPLSFAEFILFSNETRKLLDLSSDNELLGVSDISELDKSFIDYINYGGYPEVVLNAQIQNNMERFVRNDIVQKILLQDLPTLYGIADIGELNRLFTVLAYNSGQIISLETLSKDSGISKPTISKYLSYLEAAFLITILERVDQNAKRFHRKREFKVYLNNPSMRSALFGRVQEGDAAIGALAETALVVLHLQIFQRNQLYFSRWQDGEVDLVFTNSATQKPVACLEVKFSDRAFNSSDDRSSLVKFAQKHGLKRAMMTSRTRFDVVDVDELKIMVYPISKLCLDLSWDMNKPDRIFERYGVFL